MFGKSSKKAQKGVDVNRALSSAANSSDLGLPAHLLNDARRAARKEAWVVCKVAYYSGEIREGILLDVSKTGARVRFRNRGHLPATVIIQASRIGLRRKARVAWQSTFDAGLEFLS